MSKSAEQNPVAVPTEDMVRVAENALALIATVAAGAGGGHVTERIVTLWREGGLVELAGVLDEMRQTHAPPPVDHMAAALGGAVKVIGFRLAMAGQTELGEQLAEWFKMGDFRSIALAFEGLAAGSDAGRTVN